MTEIFLYSTLVGTLGIVGYKAINRKIKSDRQRKQDASVAYTPDSLELENPMALDFVDASDCSRYARLAAKYHFGVDYVHGNAWDMPEKNRIEWSADSDKSLHARLIEQNLSINQIYDPSFCHSDSLSSVSRSVNESLTPNLKEGIIMGIYYSDSRYHDKGDFTHIGLYVGDNIIHHNFKGNSVSTNLDQLITMPQTVGESGFLLPRAVIAPKSF